MRAARLRVRERWRGPASRPGRAGDGAGARRGGPSGRSGAGEGAAGAARRGAAAGGVVGRSGAAGRRTIVAIAAAGALGPLAPARADQASDRAEALFREGREAMKRGDLGEACPKFAESQELDPSPGTLLNLALCEQKRGEGARAWAHFRALVDALPPGDERAAIARARAEALAQRLPRLTVRLAPDAPPGARVWLDEVELDAARLGLPFVVDPGPHAAVVRAPGRIDRSYHVDVKAAHPTLLTVAPAAMISPPPPPEGAAGPAAGRRSGAAPALSFEQRAGYTLLALGGVSIAVGALSGFFAVQQTLNAEGTCNRYRCSDAGRRDRENARTFTLVSAFTAGGGLVVGGVGGYTLWRSASRQATAALAPAVVPRGAGVAWRLSF